MAKPTPELSGFFTPTEQDILKAVVASMVGVPRDTGLATPILAIDAFVAALPKRLQQQLRFSVHLFQWGPPLFIRKPHRFTALTPRDAVRYIESWAGSRFSIQRRLFRGLRDIAFLGYYSTPYP